MTTKIFDSKRDSTLPCFCEACLADKQQSEMSEDTRYCKDCYDFLLEEATLISGNRRPGWIPKKSKALHAKMGQAKQCLIPQDTGGIKSTLKEEKSKVDTIQPPTLLRPQAKRGPKHRVLPEDLIRSLAAEGMGSKAIASKLKAERGIDVSYKTVQRVLSGERAS